MSKKKRLGFLKDNLSLILVFVLVSLTMYLVHFLIFADIRNIFFYMVMDIAFLPLQVLILTLFINRLLSEREKKQRLQKQNMAIGTFFSEAGIELLTVFSTPDPAIAAIKNELVVDQQWSDIQFSQVKRRLSGLDYQVDMAELSLSDLHRLMSGKRNVLLRLLENPNLLEHETFTELLRALFHLTEELCFRKTFDSLSSHDVQHLQVDVGRAYRLLVDEWLDYMKYLKHDYPYLFSFAMRTNPFDDQASVFIP